MELAEMKCERCGTDEIADEVDGRFLCHLCGEAEYLADMDAAGREEVSKMYAYENE